MDHCEKLKRKVNPKETASIFSLLTFAYTGSLFRKAFQKDLQEDDLYEVLKNCNSKRCGDKLEKQWFHENKQEAPASIYRLLWHRFGCRYLFIGFVHLFWKLFHSIVEPYALSNLIFYFQSGQTQLTKNDAYMFAGLVMILNLVQGIYIHNYIIWVHTLAIEIKTAFSSLLYRKALKLTPSALSDISLGQIVTLITKDVYTFQMSIWIVNDAWIGLIQTSILCYLMYTRIGTVSFIGIALLISVIPLQIYMGKKISELRLKIGKKTDERLQVTQETLSTIRIIKMYTWERFFNKKVDEARLEEVNKMLVTFSLRVAIVLAGIVTSRMGFYVLILSYIWMGNTTDTKLVFYIMSIFKDLRQTLGVIIPYGIGKAAELYSAVIRINKVLQAEELHPKYGSEEPNLKNLVDLKDVSVYIKDIPVLRDVSFSTDSGLTLITGPVGSGKSSLLKVILQDYPLSKGQIITHGRISYASQDPWLFPSSIKQNILFGESYNEKRYYDVIKVCALEYDLGLFEKGDETIIADRGLNLSKGQQARINLARAIYKESEIYLLDDSLTALDAHVQDYIFKECIKKYLKDKICILVTQTASHISEVDKVVVMSKLKIKSVGKPDETLIKDVKDFICKEDNLEKEVIEIKSEDQTNKDDDKDETSKLLEPEKTTLHKKIYSEVNKVGEVDFAVYKKYLSFGGGPLFMITVILLFLVNQLTISYSDKLITEWVDKQQIVQDLKTNYSRFNHPQTLEELNKNSTVENVCNGKECFTILSFDNITFFNGQNFSLILKEAVAKESNTIYMYSVFILVSTALHMIKTYALFDFCRRASINIHKVMSNVLINAEMSFFDSHFIGNILNRFSQDINNIDEQLPDIFTECFRVLFAVVGIIILIASVNWTFLIPAGIFFIVLVLLRKVYLPTGRSLKRLEAATRSPMVGHLNASLEGLTTIRAYKAQNILIEEFDKHQDLFTSAHYTLICTMRAFGFLMDVLCSLFIGVIVAKFIFIDTGTSAGNVGLALTQVFMLAGMVQWGIRQWAEVENLMTSVERLLEYTDVKQETKEGLVVQKWPTRGEVTYENVNLTYGNNERVLKNINLKIEPKQKIGIVGRTGAGKSSVISTLFRLYEAEGKILIDGVDIKTLSLKFLRTKIAIIPQDPVLFSGTIRSNLDPFDEFSDDVLWSVLDKVKLKKQISNLSFEITDSGAKFSSGQKQLICLARAIVRKTKVVVLDEATANMDQETDVLLRNTIKENFADCTVFTIAHRLHSILECDKVLVLERGEIREFDDPVTLLDNKTGLFYKMVKQAGLLDYLS